MTVRWLVDNSALARAGRPAVSAALQPLFARAEVATCGFVDLELLYSARSPDQYGRIRAQQRNLPRLRVTDDVVERALDVQMMLSRTSRHRGVSIPDLLIAACAEMNGATVVHYDSDFDLIAEVTGQPAQWVVPRGSVD